VPPHAANTVEQTIQWWQKYLTFCRGSAFFVKEYFPVPYPVAINVKTGMPPFGILANHKIKMCHNSMKK